MASALREQVVESRQIGIGQGDGERPHPGEAEAEFVAQVTPHLVPEPFQGALEHAGRGLVPAVDDPAVGLAGAEADLRRLLQQDHTQPVTAQLVGDGAADDAATNDRHVVRNPLHRSLL